MAEAKEVVISDVVEGKMMVPKVYHEEQVANAWVRIQILPSGGGPHANVACVVMSNVSQRDYTSVD
jgi:hypothetical protein